MDRRQQAAALEAFDRRVRPIYDALDSRNPKTALKLVNTALEKYPDSSLVKALKAVALQRTGRQAEANKVCDELVAAAPQDDQVLYVLLLALKDLNRAHDSVSVYEAAHAKDPNNTDLMLGLFNSYVRQGSFAKQQQVATKLNKAQPSARHAWWIVLSVMLQARGARRGDLVSALDPWKLTQLAESLVSRQVSKDGKLDSFEGLLVYLDLLLSQGKVKEALEVVSGPLGDAASMSAERVHLRAALLMACGDPGAAAGVLESQLALNPDDWASLQLYCDCMIRPLASGPARPANTTPSADTGDAAGPCNLPPPPLPPLERLWPESSLLRLSGGLSILPGSPPSASALSAAATAPPGAIPGSAELAFGGTGAMPPAGSEDEQRAGLAAAQGTVRRLVDIAEGSGVSGSGPGLAVGGGHGLKLTTRGPYLASVEVAQRAAHLGLAPATSVAEAILSYIRSHGHLVSCAADLRPYSSRLPTDAAAWLAERLSELMPAPPAAEGAQEGQGGGSGSMVKEVRRWVACQQVLDDLGLPVMATETEAVARAESLVAAYAHFQPLYAGLDERERGPADELPSLAAACLVTAAACSGSDEEAVGHLLKAVLALESCIRTRPYSAPMRLSLAALYSLLGCPKAVMHQCRELEIKNIQLDSLASHHLLPALLAYGPCSMDTLRMVLRDTFTLYTDHQRDAGETLAKAYQGGAYSKVLEFVAFKERLDGSHTYAMARAERALVDIQDAAQSGVEDATVAAKSAVTVLPLSQLPTLSSQGSARLRFNEDLSTRPAWYTPNPDGPFLGPVSWWHARGRQSGQGYGRRWWAVSGSAEAASEPAAGFRDRSAAAVRARWLVCHLLGCVLQAGADQGSGAGAGPAAGAQGSLSASQLLSLVEACCTPGLAGSVGTSGTEGLARGAAGATTSGSVGAGASRIARRVAELSGQHGAEGGNGTGGSTSSSGVQPGEDLGLAPADFDLLLLGTCTLAASVVSCFNPSGARAGAGAETGAEPAQLSPTAGLEAASALGHLLAAVTGQLRSALDGVGAGRHGGVLPGSVLNGVAVVLQQHVAWICLILQAWCRWTKQAAYRKVKSDPAVEGLHAACAALRAAALNACTVLSNGLESASATSERSDPADLKSTLAQISGTGGEDEASAAERLWGWREGFDAAATLGELRKEQCAVTTGLFKLAQQHVKTLGVLAVKGLESAA